MKPEHSRGAPMRAFFFFFNNFFLFIFTTAHHSLHSVSGETEVPGVSAQDPTACKQQGWDLSPGLTRPLVLHCAVHNSRVWPCGFLRRPAP